MSVLRPIYQTPQEQFFNSSHFLNQLIPLLSPEDQANLSAVTKKCQQAIAKYNEEGPFSALPEDKLQYLFTFLGKEHWETISKVCTTWDLWMKANIWTKTKADPAIASYIDYLTILMQHLTPEPVSEDLAEQRQALEALCDRLLNLNDARPESLSRILTYNTHIEREIAEILIQLWIKANVPLLTYLSYLSEASGLVSSPVDENIINFMFSLVLNHPPQGFKIPIEISATDSSRFIGCTLLEAGHIEESIKRVVLSPDLYFRKLIQRGLFDKAFSLADNSSSLWVVEHPDFLKKTFCKECLQEGCLITADLAFHHFLTSRSCDPETLKEIGRDLAYEYLYRGEIDKALPIIEGYQFQCNPDLEFLDRRLTDRLYRNEGWYNFVSSMYTKRELLSRDELLSWDELFATVSSKPIKKGTLEFAEAFITAAYDGRRPVLLPEEQLLKQFVLLLCILSNTPPIDSHLDNF